MLNKLGEELKEARLKNEITLQQMASKTRIDIKFLEALENGNFAFLPDLYVKAFLKEYTKYVGLDENLVLKKFEFARQGKPYEEVHAAPDSPVKEDAQKEIKKEEKPVKHIKPLQTFDAMQPESSSTDASEAAKRKRIIFSALTGGTIVIIALVYFIFFNDNSEIIVPEKPIDEVIEESNKYYQDEPEDSAPDSTFAVSSDSLLLEIRTTDTSWVEILYDDRVTEDFILFPNSVKTISAGNNYKITFGKSSAIKLALNGKPLTFSPGKTPVTHVLINANGLTYLESKATVEQRQNETN